MSHLQLREGELERLRTNYPDKIPVFVTKSSDAKDSIPDIRKHKFLVPSHFKMAEFVLTIRRWLLLTPEQGIFIFIGNTLPMTGSTMGELHEQYKGKDGVLRVTYTSENTFG
jgi:Autophagy protein Atg8 ubiquitin like